MSSPAESSNNASRAGYFIRAKSGSIAETLTNFITSPFRRRQTLLMHSHRLSKTIAKITLKDIEGATRCGNGGFGTVWVLDLPLKGKVALKQLRVSGGQGDDDLLRRTLREGETWQGLNHHCVLPFLGILETPTDLYLISPYVENGSLDNYLRKQPDADRGRFLWQAAGAIAYLHGCGIVHGDIKASNILVSDHVHAMICDFGLARFETTATSTGLQGTGTTRFQSPELLRHGRGKTPASDAWAFGMTIYQVLSGNVPFHDCTSPMMIDAVANKGERPPRSPGHSPSGRSYDILWDVAEECWEEDPARRLTMHNAHERLRPESPLVLQGHTSFVWSISFTTDGKTIASASQDSTVRLWDVESASQRGEVMKGHASFIWTVAFSPDDKTVASGSDDRTVRLWDVETTSQRGGPLIGHTALITFVAWSPDGTTVVSGSYDNTVRLWDVETSSQRGRTLIGHTSFVVAVAFSLDGRTIVSRSDDKTVRSWDVESASQLGEAPKGHSGTTWALAFSPDRKTVVAGSEDNSVRLWDVESANQRGGALIGHTGDVWSVAISPDGRTVVSGSHDQTIRLWDIETETQRGEPLRGHTDGVSAITFSPDGKTVASGSYDCTIRLWDIGSSITDN